MSRTFKDRPWLVRSYDKSEPLVDEYHNHLDFGKPVYKTVLVRDEKGEVVTQDEARNGWHRTAEGNFTYGPYTRTFRVTKQVLFGYMADHCTINEPQVLGRSYRENLSPCTRFVQTTKNNRPRSWEKRYFHKGMRANERDAIKGYEKLYNGGEEVDLYEDERTETRVRFHKGYWD